ncbi:hypothetical protein [uncultured Nitrospira sp.]|uniref:hypothetical protein n=1 Tax=uncultured Nitrospira sp. TaxID=157176 RepID=UPI003140C66B
MEDQIPVSNGHAEPQSLPASVSENQKMTRGTPSEPLEVQIANRAHEISRIGGGDHGASLANWLQAAREILSEEPERPQWSA